MFAVLRCSIDGVEDKRIVSMQIDQRSHSLFVAFSSCVVKVPLSRCQRHGKCKKFVRFLWIVTVSCTSCLSCPHQPPCVSLSGPVSPPGTRTADGCPRAPAQKSHLTRSKRLILSPVIIDHASQAMMSLYPASLTLSGLMGLWFVDFSSGKERLTPERLCNSSVLLYGVLNEQHVMFLSG